MESRHGYDFLVIERQQLINILYDNLPDRNRVLQGKSVSSVVHQNDFVRVILDDGSQEEGDILVGCDGVNSTIRVTLWENSNGKIHSAVPATRRDVKTLWTID